MRLLQTSDKLTPTSASSSSSQVIPSTGLALLRLSPGNQSQVSSTTMETVSFNNEPLKLPSEIDSSSSMTSINKVHFQFGSMVLRLNNNNQSGTQNPDFSYRNFHWTAKFWMWECFIKSMLPQIKPTSPIYHLLASTSQMFTPTQQVKPLKSKCSSLFFSNLGVFM